MGKTTAAMYKKAALIIFFFILLFLKNPVLEIAGAPRTPQSQTSF
jgi:hypothetical protein